MRLVAVMVFAALSLSSGALAGGTLPGRYSVKIASPAQYRGTWVLNFTKVGTYTVARAGTVVIRGKYLTTGSKVTFSHETGPAACSTPGKYTWKRSATTLKLTRVSDSGCSGRSVVLAHTFTLVG